MAVLEVQNRGRILGEGETPAKKGQESKERELSIPRSKGRATAVKSSLSIQKSQYKMFQVFGDPQQEEHHSKRGQYNGQRNEKDSSRDYSPYEGDLLMVRRLTSAQVGKGDDSQWENIFHSCCHVLGKLYSIIIDSGNSVNFAIIRLVKKLNFPILAHPRPYKL
ncbi:hypothetical protein CR513_10118, partial [Mucuna pruriens]